MEDVYCEPRYFNVNFVESVVKDHIKIGAKKAVKGWEITVRRRKMFQSWRFDS